MSDLLSLPDIKTIEPPQENETDMMFKGLYVIFAISVRILVYYTTLVIMKPL